jgi:hypothetical protein
VQVYALYLAHRVSTFLLARVFLTGTNRSMNERTTADLPLYSLSRHSESGCTKYRSGPVCFVQLDAEKIREAPDV